MLVLTEFAGAAEELREALPCNPFDVEGLAATLGRALVLGEDDRKKRIQSMAERVATHDVFSWLGEEMNTLELAAAGVRAPGQRPDVKFRRAG